MNRMQSHSRSTLWKSTKKIRKVFSTAKIFIIVCSFSRLKSRHICKFWMFSQQMLCQEHCNTKFAQYEVSYRELVTKSHEINIFFLNFSLSCRSWLVNFSVTQRHALGSVAWHREGQNWSSVLQNTIGTLEYSWTSANDHSLKVDTQANTSPKWTLLLVQGESAYGKMS